MHRKHKKIALGGLMLLLAIVCPQLAVPLLESGAVACIISPQCSGPGVGDDVDQQ